MPKAVFLEKSYIVASILNFKNKYLNEDFVTFQELNYISNQIQKQINEQKLNAVILDNIDSDYFEISNVIIANRSKDISLESLIARYQGYLDLNLLLIIWNDERLFNYLSEFMSIKIEEMTKKFNDNNLGEKVPVLMKKKTNNDKK